MTEKNTNISFNDYSHKDLIFSNSDKIEPTQRNSSIPIKLLVIIGVIIALTTLTLVLTLVLTNKRKKINRNIRPIIPKTTEILTTDITTDFTERIIESSSISSMKETTPESSNIMETASYSNERTIVIPNYEEAEALLLKEGINITKFSHDLLNQSIDETEKLIIVLNTTNFSDIVKANKINDEDIPTNFSENQKVIIKNDLNLYNSEYKNLSQNIKNINNETEESIKNIINQLDELKNDINEKNKQYEETIKNISIPILLYSNQSEQNIRKITTKTDELLAQYINQIKEFLNCYNIFNTYINKLTFNFSSLIKTFINITDKMNILINNDISEYNKIISNLNTIQIHNSLIKTKNNLYLFNDEIKYCKNELNQIKLETEELQEETKKLDINVENFKNYTIIINNIINEFDNTLPKVVGEYEQKSNNIFNILIISIDNTTNKLNSYFNEMSDNFNINKSTSIDLLLIMDLRNPFNPYLKEFKENIFSIIDNITEECPGIDINLGFIGYRDIDENFVNLDLTQNYSDLNYVIENINASNNGIFNKDILPLLELALNKTWKSNTKLAIFVTDPSNKANGTDYSVFLSRNIEEETSQLTKESISLLCLINKNIQNGIFTAINRVYDEKKYDNTLFEIIDFNSNNNSLIEIINNYTSQVYLEQRNIEDQNCLLSKYEAIEMLKEKYGIDNPNPDDNMRFILGKCNPLLLISGLYSTKLKVEFNCQGLSTEEKDTTFKEIRLYCGNTVCKNESVTKEEHPLLFAFDEPAFGLDTGAKSYSACLGHIANYFRNENECPKNNGKNICFYSKYVKVSYYGGTESTLIDSKCGIEGICNIVQTNSLYVDNIINEYIGSSQVYKPIVNKLKSRGYKEGFSLGGLPNDYRRYIATNKYAIEVFKSQVNRLYNNTGKPVIIVGHSHGTLTALFNLLFNKDDKIFMKKIKKFIALAPPFAGSSRLVQYFFEGTRDFDVNLSSIQFSNFNIFGQYLLFKSLPVVFDLRPLSNIIKIFTNSTYNELANAIRGRIDIETKCKNKNCSINEIKEKTSKFDEIFEGYFPSLLDSECSYESNIKNNTLDRKCYTNIYNVGDCPTVITKSINPTEENFQNDYYCNKTGVNYFYQGECNNNEKNCLDQIYYSEQCPNPYDNTKAVNFILNNFNKDYSDIYGNISKNYFDSHETIRNGINNSISYQNNNNLLNDLPFPPVDIDLLYASYYPTYVSYVFDDNDFKKNITGFKRGGDQTVPTWSSLLPGLKWIYDKKKNNINQNIKLIEYCSRLSISEKYKYDPKKDQNFIALGCACLDEEKNIYNDTSKCTHSTMLSDEYIFEYIYSVSNSPNEKNNYTYSKKEAINNFNETFNYTRECDLNIFDILNSDI